ncbi:5-hydroxytryptamine receptor 1D [Halotydeus destructor]|nr:5-hydroxytryptamine receptor 1D [Halotydeus destructor]
MVRSTYVDLAIVIVYVIVILVTVVTNGLVLYFASRRRKYLPSTVFVISLAMADICVAILVMPFTAYAGINNRIWNMDPWTCKLHISSEIFLWTASVLHFPVLAVDRYEAVHRPLEYSQSPRRVKSAITLGLVWSTSALASFLLYTVMEWPESSGQRCLLKTDYVGLWSLTCFYIPLVISVILYICVYRTIKTTIGQSAVSGLAEARERERRVAKVLFIAIMSFVVCVTPITILEIYRTLICEKPCKIKIAIFGFLIAAKQLNSTCNGIILLTFNREYRSKFLKIVGFTRDGHSVTDQWHSKSKTTNVELN